MYSLTVFIFYLYIEKENRVECVGEKGVGPAGGTDAGSQGGECFVEKEREKVKEIEVSA
jgi:hypothetical protein